jgi:cation diffusion facilitator CzcD-associated flavoprotein CzcO
LFQEHCECVVSRYGLHKNLVRQETVQDISYDYVLGMSEIDKIFTVKTNKAVRYARVVVLAVGPGNKPTIPGQLPDQHADGACHAMQIQQFPDPNLKRKIKAGKETNVVVVGGGLTSAQIADLAITKGVTKVWHLMRSGLKGGLSLGICPACSHLLILICLK